MKQYNVVVAAILAGLALLPAARIAGAQTVAPCTGSCAQLTVGDATGANGGVATVPISFTQAPSNGQAGGPDEIAAIAFSLNFPGDDSHPLRLADCTISGGLPASVRPSSSLTGYRVVVENLSCAGGRTHCLCPDSGVADNFINLVIYGPDPLPTPGPGPIDIPQLPSGKLLDIDFAVSGSPDDVVPLHVTNQVEDAQVPPFRAFLSVGDREAVDQTCVPAAGTPPCSGASPVSQIAIDQGSVTVGGMSCVGDCDGSGDVTVDEIIKMVNIALGTIDLSECAAADGSGDGAVTVDEIVQAVNKALTGCGS